MCSHLRVITIRIPLSRLVLPLMIGISLTHLGCQHLSPTPSRGDMPQKQDQQDATAATQRTSRAAQGSERGDRENGIRGQMSSLLSQLGADSWTQREAAQEQMTQLGKQHADSLLKQTLDIFLTTSDPEVAYRTKQILKTVVAENLYKDGFVGVQISHATSPLKFRGQDVHPLRIDRVIPDTAAASHRLRAGDMILQTEEHVSGREFGVPEFINCVSHKGPGEKLVLVLWSAGQEITREVILGKRPDDLQGGQTTDIRKKVFFQFWLVKSTKMAKLRLRSRQRGTGSE